MEVTRSYKLLLTDFEKNLLVKVLSSMSSTFTEPDCGVLLEILEHLKASNAITLNYSSFDLIKCIIQNPIHLQEQSKILLSDGELIALETMFNQMNY